MKLSTKGRYGLRAMIDLALHCEKEVVSLSAIADRQAISIHYLEQLIAKLKKAKLVSSIRGSQGGYRLARSPKEISVGDILRALEGDLTPVDCCEVTGDGTCDSKDICVTKYVWKKIDESINQAVNTIMLSELVENSKKINQTRENQCEL